MTPTSPNTREQEVTMKEQYEAEIERVEKYYLPQTARVIRGYIAALEADNEKKKGVLEMTLRTLENASALATVTRATLHVTVLKKLIKYTKASLTGPDGKGVENG